MRPFDEDPGLNGNRHQMKAELDQEKEKDNGDEMNVLLKDTLDHSRAGPHLQYGGDY